MKFKIYTNPYTENVELFLYEVRANGQKAIVLPINPTYKLTDEGEKVEPTMILTPIAANELLNGLAESLDNAGIKPPSIHKLEGLLEATKKHLEDMRTLVFKLMEDKKNG